MTLPPRSRFSLLLSLSLTTLLAVTLLVPAGPAAARPAAESYATTAVTTTNQARVRQDLRKLAQSDCLEKMALRQARKMARQDRLFHQDLRGVQRACGMGWAGENVAVGYTNGKAVVRAWLRSPGHRANILQRHFRLVGIAAVKVRGTWWAAQVFGARA